MLVSPPGQSKQLHVGEVSAAAPDRPDAGTEDLSQFDPRADEARAQGSLEGGVGTLEARYDGDALSYWWGSGIVTHTSGRTYLAPPVTTKSLTSGAAAVGGFYTYYHSTGTRYDFCWEGPRLHRRDASNTSNSWTLVYTADVTITDFTVINGAGYICVPSRLDATSPGNTDFYYQSDPTAAATWTPTARAHAAFSESLGKPKYFRQVRTSTFAVVDNRKVFYSVDPTTDSWVGPIDTSLDGNTSGGPGDTTYPFVSALAVNDYLFVFKRDAAYNIDSQQEVTESVWQWKQRPSDRNFKFVAAGGETLYYSTGNEVWAYDPNTGRNVQIGLSKKSGFSTQEILGVGADNQYVYVLAKVRVPRIRSSASAALLRGVRVSASEWSFECIWEDTASTAYSNLAAFPYGNGTRIYWAESDGTDVKHMDVPADWDESTSGSFATSGVLYTSIWRTGYPNNYKRWLWNGVQLEAADASNTVAVAYSTDDGSTWTALGTISSSGLSNTSFSNVVSQSLVLRFTWTCAGTASPILRIYDLHGRVRTRYLPDVNMAVRVASFIETNSKARDQYTVTQVAANLRTLRSSDATIAYEDYLGNSFNVSVDQLVFQPTRHESPRDNTELEAQVVLSRADSGT